MFGNVNRLMGLNSGMDTELMIRNMMKANTMRLDKMRKGAMLTAMRRDAYRGVHKDLQTFQRSFLSVASNNSLRAPSTFASQVIDIKTSVGLDSNAVSVGAGAREGTYSVNIRQLAAAEMYESASRIGGNMQSAKGFEFDISDIRNGAAFDIEVGGERKTVSFNEGDMVSRGFVTFENGSLGIRGWNGEVTQLDEPSFVTLFNEKLKDAFGVEGTHGPQKIQAQLTQDGGISIFTNGQNSGFSIADAS
ncbi:MAG: hypothetical protein FWH00_00950, partial [Oscillospiraceae bacterium]|nr:hypothetical protein [Oscillospiraceae bacterium]